MAEVDLVLKWQQSVSQDRYADDQPLVSHLYAVCSDFYAELVSQIGADQKTDPSLLLRLQRSHSYLILWADGYGVAQGQLDSSLDRSRRAKQSTINLLISICQTLTKRLLPTLSREQQLRLQDRATDITQKVELLKLVASQDDAEDSESDTESESSQSPDTAVELDEIAEDLKTDTECLLDLGSRFKEEAVGPVLKETAVDPDELVDWDPSHTFIDRVRWRYPKCEVEVARRLGRANWSRVLRQQTVKDVSLVQVKPRTSEAVEPTVRSHLEQDSAKGSEKSKKATSSEATATSFRDSALGSSVPSAARPSRTNIPEAQDIHYAETTVSYYGEHGDVVRIPSLPAGAKDGHPFLCLSCNTSVTATTKSLWK
ncbi:hypothetical protein KJ359_008898 [Pestalotiopsis sp. 9143b]|nr:hypothetical protein KJ359_008898 [Pestalotiopsis sp. 9143b]